MSIAFHKATSEPKEFGGFIELPDGQFVCDKKGEKVEVSYQQYRYMMRDQDKFAAWVVKVSGGTISESEARIGFKPKSFGSNVPIDNGEPGTIPPEDTK